MHNPYGFEMRCKPESKVARAFCQKKFCKCHQIHQLLVGRHDAAFGDCTKTKQNKNLNQKHAHIRIMLNYLIHQSRFIMMLIQWSGVSDRY